MCNGKCNGKCLSSLGVRPMAFPQVSLGPICRVTLSVLIDSQEVLISVKKCISRLRELLLDVEELSSSTQKFLEKPDCSITA